jgi:3-dehydrotetronate 4-kinase
MPLLLGCIADDFTGATDLANNLVRAGLQVEQWLGVPAEQADHPPDAAYDDATPRAAVVALKTRTVPAAEAVAQSLQALRWLRARGARQLFFKVCSTFDSTPQGNIGPVADALRAVLAPAEPAAMATVVVTPAFPENGRTIYQGHLFVGEQLLSDSPMRDHPLTPMTEANLVRVMQAQTPHRVGLVAHAVVRQGAAAIATRLRALQAQGQAYAVVDAVTDVDLLALAQAVVDAPLVVAGSGLGSALPAAAGVVADPRSAALPPPAGASVVLAGSCSAATRAQVAAFRAAGLPVLALDPLTFAADFDAALSAALEWAGRHLGDQPLLLHATADPPAVRAVQQRLGGSAAGALMERALARLAVALVGSGAGRLVVAGGETSGAVVQALGLRRLRIGPQIDPGVPWCAGLVGAPVVRGPARWLHLALKSGNFGGEDFFQRAFATPGR